MTTFYSYQSLLRRPDWQTYLRFGVMIIGAIAIVVYIVYHLRHRELTKYRDLLVIVVVAVLLTLGLQVRDFEQDNSDAHNSQAAAALLTSIAKAKQVPAAKLYANSASVYSGMLVQIGRDPDKTYTVILDADGQSFQLRATNLIQRRSQYVN